MGLCTTLTGISAFVLKGLGCAAGQELMLRRRSRHSCCVMGLCTTLTGISALLDKGLPALSCSCCAVGQEGLRSAPSAHARAGCHP